MNIVWFKKDLRIEDNEALVQASRQGISIMPLYIND
jgi:deoxyribodipyrimidine photolyase